MHRKRLIRLSHALDIQHDYVLDQSEDLVTAPISLHDWHQILHLIHGSLAYPPRHLFWVVQRLLRNYFMSKLAKEPMRLSRLRCRSYPTQIVAIWATAEPLLAIWSLLQLDLLLGDVCSLLKAFNFSVLIRRRVLNFNLDYTTTILMLLLTVVIIPELLLLCRFGALACLDSTACGSCDASGWRKQYLRWLLLGHFIIDLAVSLFTWWDI